MDKKLVGKIGKWVEKIGHREANKRLVMAGVSGGMASKLIAGTYPNDPKPEYLQKIEEAMNENP